MIASTPSKEILRAYIKGGTSYPQIRGAIQISLCAEISKYEKEEILQFLQSTLSSEQVEIITRSMNRLHQMAGIVIPDDKTKQLIDLEWEKSKGAVMTSLLRFFRGEMNLGLRGSQIKNYLTTDNLRKIEISLSEVDSKYIKLFRDITQRAYALMYSEKKIASVFRLTFYAEAERVEEFERKRDSYRRTLVSYEIQHSPLEQPEACKKECLQVLNDKLQNNLFLDFPNSQIEIDAILWGICV